MMLDHGMLHGMQPPVAAAQPFDCDQHLAIQCGQKLYSGVDRFEFNSLVAAIDLENDDGTRSAIAIRAAFFCTGHAHIFNQELQHCARRVEDLGLYNLTIENESNSRSTHRI